MVERTRLDARILSKKYWVPIPMLNLREIWNIANNDTGSGC